MSRLQIPYNKVLLDPRDFDPAEFDSLLRHYLAESKEYPLVLEIFNNNIQYLIFIREGQFYWATMNNGEIFGEINFRKFFSSIKTTQFPKIVVYQTNLTLYHSLLVYLQKEPDLKVSSTLVDLDDLLDKIEKEKSSSLITAYRADSIIMLRYRNGKPVACMRGNCSHTSFEENAREEFLVKVYTLSTHNPFEINIYYDLVVTHSEDARMIPDSYHGTVSSFFLSQPPRITVKLKSRPLKSYTFTGKQLSIGRSSENDIVIDNLSVSRKHAVILSKKDGYILNDLGSKNGTYVNGEKVDGTELKSGDCITIGKYQILFQVPTGESGSPDSMDQTVIIPNFHNDKKESGINVHFPVTPDIVPRLFRSSNHEEYTLGKDCIVIGKKKDADIRLPGLFAARIAAEIIRKDSDYLIHKGGRTSVSINGEEMEEKVLEEEDLIAIGSEKFIFKR